MASKHATLHDGLPTGPNEGGVACSCLRLGAQSHSQFLPFARALSQTVSGLESRAIIARVHETSPMLVRLPTILGRPAETKLAAHGIHGRMVLVVHLIHAILERRPNRQINSVDYGCGRYQSRLANVGLLN